MKCPCPHCGGEINPASLLAKHSLKTRDTSSEAMQKLSKMRKTKKHEKGA